MHETGDAFAGEKWPEIGRFVGAEVSAVSFRGSDPPALVSSVSDEAADGRFVGADGGEQGELCRACGSGWADVKEKPPLREVLWGAVKYSSPRHAEKCSILPILSEQGRYFFH